MVPKTYKDIEIVSNVPEISIRLRFPKQDDQPWLAAFWCSLDLAVPETMELDGSVLIETIHRGAEKYMDASDEPETNSEVHKLLIFIVVLHPGEKIGTSGIPTYRWQWIPNHQNPTSIKFIASVGAQVTMEDDRDMERYGVMCVKLITEFAFNEDYNKENDIEGSSAYVDVVENNFNREDELALNMMREHFRWREGPGHNDKGEEDDEFICFTISREEYEEQVEQGTFYSKD